MKRSVLMKKNKVLAFALAAAMAFTSVPMNTVHAEGAGETGGAAGDEAQGGEASSDTETWTTILDMGFGDEGKTDVKAEHVTVDSTVEPSNTKLGDNESNKLLLKKTDDKVTVKLGNGYDSGKVKIVVETYSSDKSEGATSNGQFAFKILDASDKGHALVNIGHFGGYNLYTTDLIAGSSIGGNALPYKGLTDDTVNRGKWVRLEAEIDLGQSKEKLDLKATLSRSDDKTYNWTSDFYNSSEGWSGAIARGKDWLIDDKTIDADKTDDHTKGCACDDADFSVGAIVFELKGGWGAVDNISVSVTGDPKKELTLDSVEKTAGPTKTEYAFGEALDLTGMVLTETYSDGSTKKLNTPEMIEAAYDISGYAPKEAGDQNVTLKSKKDETKTVEFAVTVKEFDPSQASKYIFSYDAGQAPDSLPLSNVSLATANTSYKGKQPGGLQFSKKVVGLPDFEKVSSGVVVYEWESFPAGDTQQGTVFYNSKGEELFAIGCNNSSKIPTKTIFMNAVLGDAGSDTCTPGGEIATIYQAPTEIENFSNRWLRYRVEFYLDNTEVGSEDKVLKYKVFVSYVDGKERYPSGDGKNNWMPYNGTDQNKLINSGKANANGTVTAAIDGSTDHPFDLGSIKLFDTKKGRWFGNFSLSHITNIELTKNPGEQTAGVAFNPGEAEVTLTYSTGKPEVVKLADLTLGTDYTVAGLDEAGANKEITITYLGKDLKVEVPVKELKSIQVTPPSKTYVEKGEALDKTGMKVEGVYEDGTTVVLSEKEYDMDGPDTSDTGKKPVKVILKANTELTDTFNVTVTIKPVTDGVKDVFSYNGEVEKMDDLGFTLSDGVTADLDKTNVAGNETQKLLITGGSATKEWGYDLTSGVVKITTELKKGNDAAFYRVLDEEGNPLIFIGQFSGTNLYDSQSKIGENGTKDKPYVTVASGSGTNWIRLETEIDLDTSNTKKNLQFVTKIYSLATYPADGNWGTPAAIVTAEDYNDGADFNTDNGCATASLKSFSVSAVELSGRQSGKNAYFDNVYVGATQAVTLEKVKVTTVPTKKNYPIGATTLDLTDMVLTEYYSNKTTKELKTVDEIKAAYDITGFDADTSATAGTKTIRVENKENPEIADEFTVEVQNITISGIEIETGPTTKLYYMGDTELDTEGLVVKATYSDGSTGTLLEGDYEVSKLQAKEAGEETITVTSVAKNAENQAVTATFKVTIKQPVVTGIEMTQAPSKLTYKKGETEIDLTGIVVMATYDSGKKVSVDVKDLEPSGLDTSAETTGQIIIVTYAGFTKTYTITVVDPANFKPVEFAYDFNIEDTNSKTAEGWTGIFVNKKSGSKYGLSDYAYNKDRGYGLDTTVTGLQGRYEAAVKANGDYVSIPADVYKDYVLFGNAEGSFDVDIANGTYNVQIIMGTVESNTTTIQIEGNSAYTGTASLSKNESVVKVIEIPGVQVTDGQMNILPTADGNARTNGIIISNISAPSGLRGEFKADELSVSLSWNDSLGCVKYNVYRRAADGTIKMLGTTEGTSIKDETADLLQTYTYYVRGISEKGLETIASNQAEITIGDDSVAKPAAPASVTVSFIDPESVTLTWDEVPGADIYEIYTVADNKLVDKTRVTAYQVKDKNHLDKSYKVVAANAGGRSDATNVTPGAVPGVPENFEIQALTGEATTLKWDAATDAKYYEVYSILKSSAEGKTGLDGYSLAGSTTNTSFSCTLADHMSRYYKVVAVGLGGRGTATDVANSDFPAPEKPLNVTAVPTEEKTTITWDAPANAAYYEIYWSDRDRTDLKGTKYETNGIEDYELLGTSNDPEYVLNLPTHIERYFRVVAVGLGGKSGPSDPAKAEIVKKFNPQMEYLDRGLVAIKVDGGVYLGWRLTGDEYEKGATYKLYRGGECIRTFTADQNTSYLDTTGTAESKYAVSVVIDGVEGEKCKEVAVQTTQYMDVKLNQPEPYYDDKLTKDHIKSTYAADTVDARVNLSTGEYVYTPNDTYIGDVDGDGQYELIVKWDGMSRDNSQGGYTSPVIIDCYKLDGTQLWRINLGINVRAGAHYTQPVVGDLDGDGRAEVMMRTSDGSVDGKGNIIGAAGKDYRNTGSSSSKGQVITGPEYLTLFDGETGEALDIIDYVPERGRVNEDWKAASKGDSYGGRSERFLSGAAYLDGENLSAVFARGYYGRAVVVAFTVENKKIKQLWKCDSKDAGNESLFGQGAHSFTVADVDGDGCQEIVYGSATIDHDGKVMYSLSTKQASSGSIHGGHGDAERVTDMDLRNPGLEAFMVHEEHPNDGNAEMHDAGTGDYIFAIAGNDDIGRGASGDIDPAHEGGEFWFQGASQGLYGYVAESGKYELIGNRPSSVNHMVWFDGTMGRNFLDGSYDKTTGKSSGFIAKYENGRQVDILRDEGVEVNNTTKSNPCFQADIFGDWREEVAWRTDDNQYIRIYTSNEVQDFRLYTLMHDPTYRAQMACNGSAYNQSPDAGFYIGYDTELIQVPISSPKVTRVADYSEVNAAIADAKKLNPDEYVNYDIVLTAIDAVVRGRLLEEQESVDNMAKAIRDAIAGLKKPADYTAVDAAIARAEALNAADYVNYEVVQAAIDAVTRGLTDDRQTDVDNMAKAIEDAIAALKRPADYTAVDAAIEKAKALNADLYLNYNTVQSAIDAVVRGYAEDKQAEVDAFAQAINAAIEALEKKPADYSGVENVKKEVEKLFPAEYENFDIVQAAIDAVVAGKKIDEQSEVDAFAEAIKAAIGKLVKKGGLVVNKPGDPTKTENYIAKKPEGALETIEIDKEEKQPLKNAIEEAVKQAVAGGATVSGGDSEFVSGEDALSRIKSIMEKVRDKALENDKYKDGVAKSSLYEIEVKRLVQVEGAQSTEESLTKFPEEGMDIYVPFPEGVTYVAGMKKEQFIVTHMVVIPSFDGGQKLGDIVREKILKVDENGLLVHLSSGSLMFSEMLNGEIPVPADYSGVEAAIAAANALNPENYKNYDAVRAAINAVVYDLNDDRQAEVDAMAAAINAAVAALQPKDPAPAETPKPDTTPEPSKPNPDNTAQPDDEGDEDDGPEETADNKSDDKSSTPAKTGDHMTSFVWMWTIVMAVAVAGIATMLAVKVRRKKDTE